MGVENHISEALLKDKASKGLSLIIKDGSIETGMLQNECVTKDKISKSLYDELKDPSGNISNLIVAVDKITQVVEEWPDVEITHTIKWEDIDTIVTVNSVIDWPEETVIWNPKVSNSNGDNTITYTKYLKNVSGTTIEWEEQDIWTGENLGNNVFILSYNYPSGEYIVKSNLGNTKVVILAEASGQIKKTVQVTYPWYINDTPQELVAIGGSTTVEYPSLNSPKIKVPFTTSTIDVKADIALNGNYNPVANWIENEEELNGITYKVYYGEDSFSEPVPHKITIKIVEDDGI